MRTIHRSLLACLFGFGLASVAAAQTAPAPAQSDAIIQQNPLTGKERLGPKWTDEQRIDNCKVPPHKRGPKSRSSECPHVPTG